MSPKPKTVLIVDDDEGMRDTLTAILKRDYRVLRVSSGEAALPILNREDIDLMLLDVRLPGISGGLKSLEALDDIEAALDRTGQRLEGADQSPKQCRLAGAVGTDHRDQGARGDLTAEVVHRRVPVITQRDVTELQLRGHAHLIASHTAAHSTALTANAAPSRETTVMRRIDHGAACAGCGVAGPWLWAWPWAWSWSR